MHYQAREDAIRRLSDAVAFWRIDADPASDVIDAAVECLVADVDSPALRELAGESPRESRFILDPLIDQALDELGVEQLVAASPERAALRAVLRRYRRGELSAAAAAQWAHRYIGHKGDAECLMFVDFYDMYNTVDYASYTVGDLYEWMAEERDAFLAGRACTRPDSHLGGSLSRSARRLRAALPSGYEHDDGCGRRSLQRLPGRAD